MRQSPLTMKKALSWLSLFIATVICLPSCEADGDGGSSTLDGNYVLQYEEIHYKMKTPQDKDYTPCFLSLDFPSRTYTGRMHSVEIETETLSEKEWIAFVREAKEIGLGAPVGVEFHKDGSALLDVPEKWYEDVEYWDVWFDQDDLDNFRVPVKYSVSNDIVTFTFLNFKSSFFKIVSNSGNTLKVELTKQALKQASDEATEAFEDEFEVIVESTTAVYKK